MHIRNVIATVVVFSAAFGTATASAHAAENMRLQYQTQGSTADKVSVSSFEWVITQAGSAKTSEAPELDQFTVVVPISPEGEEFVQAAEYQKISHFELQVRQVTGNSTTILVYSFPQVMISKLQVSSDGYAVTMAFTSVSVSSVTEPQQSPTDPTGWNTTTNVPE